MQKARPGTVPGGMRLAGKDPNSRGNLGSRMSSRGRGGLESRGGLASGGGPRRWRAGMSEVREQ